MSSQNMSTEETGASAGKLGAKAKLGYGVGDLAINLFFQSSIIFLLYFYTDIFGISAAAAATLFLVARLVDAVTDPMMGAIADRTRTRWGKFRPYLLWGAPPLALVTLAMFSAPDLSDTGKLVYAYVTYILFSIAYTVVSIPYSSLTAVITDNSHERTVLTAYRMSFALGGGIIVGVGTQPLVTLFGGGALGFQITIGLYGLVAIVVLALTFLGTAERVEAASQKAPTVKEMMKVLSGNLPLWLIIIAFFAGMLAFTIRASAVIFYFSYNLGRADIFPLYMLAILSAQFAGILVTPSLSGRFGKKQTYIGGALLGIVMGIALYLTPYDALGAVFIFSIVGSFCFAAPTVLGWAMLPDTVEYAQWKQGVRADGAIYATASFFQKLAMAIGGALAGVVLASTGYVANEAQSPEALGGILAMVSLLPVAALTVGSIAIWFYPIDEELHARMRMEIKARATSLPAE
ncbi:MAG: MFS transporter [Parvibaculum sp.]